MSDEVVAVEEDVPAPVVPDPEPQVLLQAPAADVTYTGPGGQPYISGGDGTVAVWLRHVEAMIALGFKRIHPVTGDPLTKKQDQAASAEESATLETLNAPVETPAPLAEGTDSGGGFAT